MRAAGLVVPAVERGPLRAPWSARVPAGEALMWQPGPVRLERAWPEVGESLSLGLEPVRERVPRVSAPGVGR